MNIYDISHKAGVSIATVSRVINGSSSVSERTRNKVLDAIRECGYIPNPFARGLGLNTMKTVGILCADSSDSYLARAVYIIEQDLRSNGYDSLLCCTGYNPQNKASSLNLLMSKHVDAIIMVGSNYVEPADRNNDYIREAAKRVPVMMVNGELDAQGVYCVMCDDYGAMYNVTSMLIKQGRKRLLFISNSLSLSARKKYGGFIAAAKENYVESSVLQLAQDIAFADAVAQIKALYESGNDFDGIVATEDMLAVCAMKYLKSAGKSIPDDVQVTGCNNSDLALCCEPELTSIDNKLEPLSHCCVNTLMGIFAGSENVTSKTILTADIIKRGTTA